MKSTLQPGLRHTHTLLVDDARVIKFMGDDCQVYATPSLISDVEFTCRELILQHLDAGEDSVGTRVNIEHLGPAVLGARVTINVAVSAVEGRRVGFDAEVLCGPDRILTGSHERFVVDALKVRERLLKKKAQQLGGMNGMIDTALFDLGKVLLDWDPRYYYAQHFGDDTAALEAFVRNIVAQDWIVEMDAGKPAAQAIAERQALHPDHADLIGRWSEGWPQMLRGEIEGTSRIVRALKDRGLRLYALTNFSAETFPIAMQCCPTMALFDDIVVSGRIGMIKPDRRIYAHAIRQCALDPACTVFIDDSQPNVAAGREAGFHALHFESPQRLRDDLRQLGLQIDTDLGDVPPTPSVKFA